MPRLSAAHRKSGVRAIGAQACDPVQQEKATHRHGNSRMCHTLRDLRTRGKAARGGRGWYLPRFRKWPQGMPSVRLGTLLAQMQTAVEGPNL